MTFAVKKTMTPGSNPEILLQRRHATLKNARKLNPFHGRFTHKTDFGLQNW